ncbi:Receptor activity-modifying protein 2 [Oryzias melastigma]|uniref:Receptor (G protein-coupled) activity modifying protein 2 n=1 Tax=Oryzias melastigma TaxID=30732 RepID=A0A3B3E1K1_ORYME|nr:receptor activity-modifying protein 2 isoform X1 [Oryzias melastigma]KAF6723952.1 Receptor activity-modifying protein 2 [Oryzias melastigma]
MNTALDKMTLTRFPLVLSGCFITLLMCATAATNESTVTCGSGQICESLCGICEEVFGGPTMDCLSALFEHSCLPKFNYAMDLMNTTDWCVWGNVNSLYSNLSLCTEEMSDCLQIPWPNPLVEDFFVDIHSAYFKECPTEEFSDPTPATVFALVITPICLIPVMVSLVVLKTKNGDGSS